MATCFRKVLEVSSLYCRSEGLSRGSSALLNIIRLRDRLEMLVKYNGIHSNDNFLGGILFDWPLGTILHFVNWRILFNSRFNLD